MKKPTEPSKSAPTANRRRSSHLYLQEKSFRVIPKLNKTKEILVLYLYGNLIQKIENLNCYTNLVSLYLQNNQLSTIENLHYMKKLKKLYIGHNNISVLEGLCNNIHLEELHIEKQYLPEGASLCFDPRSVMALSIWVSHVQKTKKKELKQRFEAVKTIKDTRIHHFFIPINDNTLEVSVTSNKKRHKVKWCI